jgi:predicted NBD/HSP70 family sugar kinase
VAVRRDVCNRLADAVSLVVQTVDPDVIVLGGGVAESGDLLAEVRRTLQGRAERSRFVAALHLATRVVMLPPRRPVVNAGAIGAARVARAAMPRGPKPGRR